MSREQQVEALFDPERRRAAREYSAARRRWALVGALVFPVYLLLWPLTGIDARITAWLLAFIPFPLLAVVAFFLILGFGYWLLDTLVAVPVERLARRYGLSVQDWEHWLTDRVKAGVISAIFGILAVWGIYGLMDVAGSLWWLWTGLAAMAFSFLLTVLAPVVIAPLFYRFTPIEDQAVRERLLAVAERAGVSATGVYRFDMSRRSRAANAAVVGVGATRRIIVADTLLDAFPLDEVETVLAHELAHHIHRDMLWNFLLTGILTLVGFRLVDGVLTWVSEIWAVPPTSPQTLPVLLLTFLLFAWITSPLVNLWSRSREALADMFAVLTTGKGEAFARALARLADQNLADLWPPRWYVWLFGTHPPLGERVNMALEIANEANGAPTNSIRSPT